MENMRKKIIFIAMAVSLAGLASCRRANELPPLNEGYATEFIMPDPEPLTSEEREYLDRLEREYNDAIK